ncbi:bifunctional 4-hydroxy-2-oxoglutarate aldolase/2-dehydro-3-deoxy-phosphogluconate aldolase [Pseudarthrobacter raffinosi]|uniref:bifunctional 4-hydroxy-2-oxoglutarate aldolase/2-dehydro-3-deoxy-phosphogluconate aldolase n=1 Tax=Pseudarthrobacter raffinosi TaxID=2953651 RepID=UPI00208F06A5|nr:bifunctional 4-hydroxy-2-oxoglutarate aldolase/2-dehydro-3-deoxy-phosphogluconate aldolase [Pseudarthrobacter sp. MDT3-9]MCO4253259.1 bifunctional 4-hydroxy-2-oxoglutarate aldolase/2-dehydro-3-deoxy-phosphogluconate aldolase [Pseudarthrobacter sp. MDT3-9]
MSTTVTTPEETIERAGVVPVVVVEAPQALHLGRALLNGGLPLAEITFRTAGAVQALEILASQLPELLVGAGTVLNARQVDDAVSAGARFIISPGLSAEVVHRARHHNVPVFPGVATPSDIMAALDLNITTMKCFPVKTLGGLPAVKALSAPFPQVRFIPTGGINAESAPDYLQLSNVLAVGGSWMVDPALIAAGDWNEITRRSLEAAALTGKARSKA